MMEKKRGEWGGGDDGNSGHYVIATLPNGDQLERQGPANFQGACESPRAAIEKCPKRGEKSVLFLGQGAYSGAV